MKSVPGAPTVPKMAPKRNDSAGREAPWMNAHTHATTKSRTSVLVQYLKRIDRFSGRDFLPCGAVGGEDILNLAKQC